MRDTVVTPPGLVRQLGDWRTSAEGPVAWRGLSEALRRMVLDGRLPLNARLPGERRLAEALGVSRITVTAALDRLREEGFVVSRSGSGSVTALPYSPASRPEALIHQAGRPGVIDMTAAVLPATEQVHAAYARALEALPAHLPGHGYEPVGVESLRRVLADRYGREGLPTTPDHIVVTAGAQNALALVLRAATRPGQTVVIDHPSYPHAIDALLRMSLVPAPVALTPSGWDMDGLLSTIRRARPRLTYLITAHHNPTGHVMTAADEAAVAAAVGAVDGLLVLDDTLRDLWFDRPPPPPAEHGPHVVRLGSTAKLYWGGLRVGWLRAAPEIARAVILSRPSLDLGTPVMEQLAAALLLAGDEGPVRERRRRLVDLEAHLRARLADALPDWRAPRPPGGLSHWIELPRPSGAALVAAAERRGVRLAPGSRFGVGGGAFDRFLRLPFTLSEAELDHAVERIADAWSALDRRTPTPRSTALPEPALF
jgi:DNA-binding transcriptional MocR family regulator